MTIAYGILILCHPKIVRRSLYLFLLFDFDCVCKCVGACRILILPISSDCYCFFYHTLFFQLKLNGFETYVSDFFLSAPWTSFISPKNNLFGALKSRCRMVKVGKTKPNNKWNEMKKVQINESIQMVFMTNANRWRQCGTCRHTHWNHNSAPKLIHFMIHIQCNHFSNTKRTNWCILCNFNVFNDDGWNRNRNKNSWSVRTYRDTLYFYHCHTITMIFHNNKCLCVFVLFSSKLHFRWFTEQQTLQFIFVT